MSLTNVFLAVKWRRELNDDVFKWPGVLWDGHYVHEEVCEFMRVVQTINAPDHARNSTDSGLSLDDRKHLEWGQALMMLVTLGIEAGVTDPDRALDMALEKIDTVSERKRKELAT
jgi:hypothetical protein